MERRISGFRTAMEQAADISSINSNEFLEPGNSDGEIFYDLYGMADSGLEHSVNKDNLYMDGIYMKSFQFSHYSKGIRTFGNNAFFALCGPGKQTDDSGLAAAKIMDVIDGIRPMLCKLGVESGAEVIQEFVQSKLPGVQTQSMAFGAIYAAVDGVAAIAMGGAVIYRLKGSKLVPVGGSKQNVGCYFGNKINGDCDIIPLREEETYVICSPVMAKEFALETVAEAVYGASPEEAVRKIMDKGVTMCRGQNISMMVVRISLQKKKTSKFSLKKLIAPVAVICIAALIAAAAFSVYFLNKKPDDEIRGGETLEEFNKNNENKAIAEATLTEFEIRLTETETALQVYKDVLAECEKAELNNGSESNEITYSILNESINLINSDLQSIRTEIELIKSESKNGSEMLVRVEELRGLVDRLGSSLLTVESASKDAVVALGQKRQAEMSESSAGSGSSQSGSSGGGNRGGVSGGYSGGYSSGGGSGGGASGGYSGGTSSGGDSAPASSSSEGPVAASAISD